MGTRSPPSMDPVKSAETEWRLALGRRLQRVRDERGLTQEAVRAMAAAGWGENNLSRWETGTHEIGVHDALRLARIYGITLDHLIDVSKELVEPPVPLKRTAAAHYELPAVTDAVRSAKSIEDLAELFGFGIQATVTLPPNARPVSADEAVRIRQLVLDRIHELKGIPDAWVARIPRRGSGEPRPRGVSGSDSADGEKK